MTRPPTPTPNTNRTKKLYGQAGNKPSSTDYRAKSGLKPSTKTTFFKMATRNIGKLLSKAALPLALAEFSLSPTEMGDGTLSKDAVKKEKQRAARKQMQESFSKKVKNNK